MHWNQAVIVALLCAFFSGVVLTALFFSNSEDPADHTIDQTRAVPHGDLRRAHGRAAVATGPPDSKGRAVLDALEPEAHYVPVGPKDLTVVFDGDVILVDGVPLDEVDLEGWDAERLQEFREQIRPLQLDVFNDLRANVPLDGFFVSGQEYVDQRRWHEDKVFFAMSRPTDDPEQPIEYGFVEIPHSLSPEAYVLMDAVVRSYRAPASAAELMAKGSAYEQQVRAEHPDATLDVTDDLTKWTFFASDGRIVGQTSHTRNANN